MTVQEYCDLGLLWVHQEIDRLLGIKAVTSKKNELREAVSRALKGPQAQELRRAIAAESLLLDKLKKSTETNDVR